MKPKVAIIMAVMLMAALVLAACAGEPGAQGPVGPQGPPGPLGPAGPPGQDAAASQEYVGSETCGACHEGAYSKFMLSGHPYKLTKIDGAPPSFPYDSETGGVRQPPEGYTWDDISYVIGGFKWKARFIDQRGYIITGDENATTQFNFANAPAGTRAEWVPYHAGEVDKAYDCGACHTTGYRPEGHQDGLEGIIGTWAQPGIQCEACHGPGSRHAEDPYGVRMVLDRSSQQCGECHIRGNPATIDASNGFERHHQQYEDLLNSKHFATSCVACHDPHASSVYADADVNPDKGIIQTCETCHWQQVEKKVSQHNDRFVSCDSCHMPPMARSAVGNPDTFTGDVRSHQFAINTDPAAPQFSDDGDFVMPYLTLPYVCGQCHNDEVVGVLDLETLAEVANGYHNPPPTEEEQ